MTVELTGKRVAVLSDIHSNYHAFKACVADARRRGADSFVFLGDYISDLSGARETLDLVYALRDQYPTVCLRGNRERYMLEHRAGKSRFCPGSRTGSLLYTYEQLTWNDFDFLENLPDSGAFIIGNAALQVAHAVPGNDRFYFEEKDDRISDVFAGMKQDWLLTGHSHKQYLQRYKGKTILNPGSVGVPRGYGDLAQYALLEIENGGVNCVLRQVPYDLQAAIHAQFASELMALAPHWAVSVLYDVITGEEYTMELLTRVFRQADGNEAPVNDEGLWREISEEMGMRFTEEELLAFAHAHMDRL